MRLYVGLPPILVVKRISHDLEGPAVTKEFVEEMLRSVASTREMRVFRKLGTVDVIVPFDGTRFLVRARRKFSNLRLELLPIPECSSIR